MEIDGVFFCRQVALALGGDHMQQNRFIAKLDIVKNIDEMIDIVTVDGTEVFKIEGFE